MIADVAKRIAKKYHAGQKDRAGVDYFEGHLTTVASNFDDPLLQAIAYCHDILEDTDISQVRLTVLLYEEGVDLDTIEKFMDAVLALTKVDEQYYDYLYQVKENELARQVKLADLDHNMDLSRLKNLKQKDFDRLEKYKNAKLYLESA